ncbi:MAG: Cna B-type domain-containing protein [Clostridiales Family XIII bacterium]|jgi:predicted nucleic acid-binding Zn ribbon protein|nr:Cna B-type domain-containing protein [Clostridiales Family XIII bacterium]
MFKKRGEMRKCMALILAFSMIMMVVYVPAFGEEPLNSSRQIVDSGGTSYYNGDDESANSWSNAMVEVSKNVTGTELENVFNISLKVRTKNEVNKELSSFDAAVALVIDTSYSMGVYTVPSGANRLAVAKEEAADFVDMYSQSAFGAKRYIAVIEFNGPATVKQTWIDVSNTDGLNKVKAVIGDLTAGIEKAATNVEAGLLLARNLLGAPPAGLDNETSKRFVLLLSDGDTTHYVSGGSTTGVVTVPDPISNITPALRQNATDNQKLTAKERAEAVAKQLKTNAETLGTYATDAYPNTATLYTIAFAEDAPADWLGSKIASEGCSLSADDAAQLNDAFTRISDEIKREAQAWIVTDPMGEYIDFKGIISGGDGNVTSYDASKDVLTWDIKEAQAVQSSETGGSVWTYELSYTVEFNNLEAAKQSPSAAVFPTNGETKLSYVIVEGEGTSQKVSPVYVAEFKVPEVKSLLGKLEFEKIDAYSKKPISKVEFTVKSGDYTQNAVSDDNGNVVFTDLPSGRTYTLTETSAPGNYDKSSGSAEVYVGWEGAALMKSGEALSKIDKKYVVENRVTAGSQTISVDKVWMDGGRAHASGEVYISLFRYDTGAEPQTAVVAATKAVPEVAAVPIGNGSAKVTFYNLPVRNIETGKEYIYYCRETDAAGKDYVRPGYKKAEGGSTAIIEGKGTITNVLVSSGTVTVKKVWVETPGAKHGDVKISLTRQDSNGTHDAEFSQSKLLSADASSVDFENLDFFDTGGKAYTYIASDSADGYGNALATGSVGQNGEFTITLKNIQDISKARVTGDIIWMDNSNAYGTRPESVNVLLTADGQTVETINVTGAAEAGYWTVTSANEYPAYRLSESGDAYIPIVYRFVEQSGGQSLAEGGAFGASDGSGDSYVVKYGNEGKTITNTLTGRTELSVKKVWIGDDASDRPDSVIVRLLRNGAQYAQKELAADSVYFGDLPKYNSSGSLYSYSAIDSVPHYRAVYDRSENLLINEYVGEGIAGQKLWQDSHDRSARPSSITVDLIDREGNVAASKEVEGDPEADEWSFVFTDIQELSISLPSEEVPMTPFASASIADAETGTAVSGGDVSSDASDRIGKGGKHDSGAADSVGVVNEDAAADGSESEANNGLEVEVFSAGITAPEVENEVISQDVKTGAGADASELNTLTLQEFLLGEFLPLSDESDYTVRERTVPAGYSAARQEAGADDEYTIINSKSSDLTIVVKKDWLDEGANEIRPDGSFELYKMDGDDWVLAGSQGAPKTNGEVRFEGLERYGDDGDLITYKVDEVLPPDSLYRPVGGDTHLFTSSAAGNYETTFINKLSGVLTNFNFTKIWIIPEGSEHPGTIRVQLLKNGEPYGDAADMDVSSGTVSFNDLPKYEIDDGLSVYTLNAYTVRELDAEGAFAEAGGSVIAGGDEYIVWYDNGVIVNVLAAGVTSLDIIKNWYAPTNRPHPAAEFTLYQRANGNAASDRPYGDKLYTTEGDTAPSVRIRVTDLPLHNESRSEYYTYYAVETGVPAGYELRNDESTPPNTFNNWIIQEDASVKGVKSWDTEDGDAVNVDVEIAVGLFTTGSEGESILLDVQSTSADKDWGYEFNVPDGKYSTDNGQYVRYLIREMSPGGEPAPVPRDTDIEIGGKFYHVAYASTERDANGDITANIKNTLLSGYYYNVAAYYRTVINGVPGDWSPKQIKRELSEGEAGQTISLEGIAGRSAAQTLIGEWASWDGYDDYRLVEELCVTSVTLSRPGRINAAEIAYYFERSIIGLGSGSGDDDDNGGNGGDDNGGNDNNNNNGNNGGGNGTLPDDNTSGGQDNDGNTTTDDDTQAPVQPAEPPEQSGGGDDDSGADIGAPITPVDPGGGAPDGGGGGTPAVVIPGAGTIPVEVAAAVTPADAGAATAAGNIPSAPNAATPATPGQPAADGMNPPAGNPPVSLTVQEMLDRQTPITGISGLLQNIADGNVPLAAPSFAVWSLLSLILSLLGLVISLMSALRYVWRKHHSEEEENEYEMILYERYGIDPPTEAAQKATVQADSNTGGVSCSEEAEEEMRHKWRRRKLTLILMCTAGILVGVLFLILDDMRLPMAWINTWTPLIAVVFIIHVIITFAHRRTMRKEDEENNKELVYEDAPAAQN